MFEKARAAFFGTVKIPPQPFDQTAAPLNPREKPTPKEITPGSLTATK